MQSCQFVRITIRCYDKRSMVRIEPISPKLVELYKSVRLRALKESPLAFGSTYAKESQLSEAEWQNRATRLNGVRSAGYLAIDDAVGCGIALGFVDENDETRAHLISMWVAPSHRRSGVGRSLVKEVVEWAHGRDVRDLILMVTSSNDSAIRFYQHIGFEKTGRTEPYPNDTCLFEFEMSCPLSR